MRGVAGRGVGLRAVVGAVAAVAALAIASMPYSPTLVYEGRYLIIVFADGESYGPHQVMAFDEEDGGLIFGYGQYEITQLPDGYQGRGWSHVFGGQWGPSHGPWPLLKNGYPAPYLTERSVRAEGTADGVRVWEGAGVEDDCYTALEDAGLAHTEVTGGGQGWGPHRAPMGYPTWRGNPWYDDWQATRWLTCVWIDLGPPPGAPAPDLAAA